MSESIIRALMKISNNRYSRNTINEWLANHLNLDAKTAIVEFLESHPVDFRWSQYQIDETLEWEVRFRDSHA